MLSLRHIVSRRLAAAASAPAAHFLAFRRYHGDPGPQTSAHRKSQRHRLREATLGGGGSVLDGEAFQSLLSAEPIAPSKPRVWVDHHAGATEPRRPREPVLPRRDGAMRRDRPARLFDQASGKWTFAGSDGPEYRKRDAGRVRFKPQEIKAFNAGRRDPKAGPARGVHRRMEPSSVAGSPSQGVDPLAHAGARLPRNNGPEDLSQRPVNTPRNPNFPWQCGPRATTRSPLTPRSKDDPYHTSGLLRDHIKASDSPMSNQDIEVAMRIFDNAPRSAINVVVWNQLLALLGREGRFEKMWKGFNDMKKSGIKPSAHTFTTLLNAYAGISHSSSPFHMTGPHSLPPTNHLSRVSLVWEQAQKYLANATPSNSGLDVPGSTPPPAEQITGPVNAYLKFLRKYRMWDQIWDLYQESKTKGEVWDRAGFTTTFAAMLSLARRQAQEAAGGKGGKVTIGPMARELWVDATQRLEGKKAEFNGMDNILATTGVATLLMGRPEDQRFAMKLIPEMWGLTPLPITSPSDTPSESPFESPSESTDPEIYIPRRQQLKLDCQAATFLIQALSTASRPTLASHYATVILSQRFFRREADTPLLYACATAFADTGDITSTLDLLAKHGKQAPVGGWKMGFWYDCLSAARWARVEGDGGGKGDWWGIKSVLGFMGVIPKPPRPSAEGDEWKRKRAPVVPVAPVQLDAKAMTIILKTALGRNKAEVLEAVQILEKGGLADVLHRYEAELQGRSLEQHSDGWWQWSKELSKDVRRAIEGLGERDTAAHCSERTIAVLPRLAELGRKRAASQAAVEGEKRSARAPESYGQGGVSRGGFEEAGRRGGRYQGGEERRGGGDQPQDRRGAYDGEGGRGGGYQGATSRGRNEWDGASRDAGHPRDGGGREGRFERDDRPGGGYERQGRRDMDRELEGRDKYNKVAWNEAGSSYRDSGRDRQPGREERSSGDGVPDKRRSGFGLAWKR